MIDYKKFKFATKETFYSTTNIVNKHHIDIIKEKNLLPSLVKLCDNWKVLYDDIATYIIKNHLTKDLFDYTSYPNSHSKLVCENGLYTITRKWGCGGYNEYKTYFNVYVIENPYIHLIFPKLIDYIIKTYYPYFVLTKKVMKNNIEIKPYETISELSLRSECRDLTINDLVDIANKKVKYVDELVYNIYSDGDFIYYPLENIIIHGHTYNRSISIPREAIINKNWNLVENQYVSSIIKDGANELLGRDKNNWFSGYQKDSPYWKEKNIRALRRLFEIGVE